MGEARRQQYLHAMGLNAWYGRFPLPGAPASPEYDFSGFEASAAIKQPQTVEATKAVLAGKRTTLAASTAKAAAMAELSVLRSVEPVSQESPGASSTDLPVVEAAGSAASSSPRASSHPGGILLAPTEGVEPFLLRVRRLAGCVAVCRAGESTELQREDSLLLNLAGALRGEGDWESLFEFQWPVFGNLRLPGQGGESARLGLLMLLRPWLHSMPRVVFFGVPSIQLWPGLQGEMNRPEEITDPDVGRLHVLVTHSLDDMLLESRRKKEVWQHLRTFLGTGIL